MKRATILASLVAILLTLAPRGAAADVTGFYGLTVSPWSRAGKGFAVGVKVIAIGMEFEYSTSAEDKEGKKPGLTTYSVNALVQTPISIKGVRLYGTVGGGVYHMLSGADDKFGMGLNFGGGVRVSVVGPVNLRVDYRIFSLLSPPIDGKPQRLYAGVNLDF